MDFSISDAFVVMIVTTIITLTTSLVTLVTTIVAKCYDQRRSAEGLFFKEKLSAYASFPSVSNKEFAATNSSLDLNAIQHSSNTAMLLSTKTTSDLIANYCFLSIRAYEAMVDPSVDRAILLEASRAYQTMFFAMQSEILAYHHIPFWKRQEDNRQALRNHKNAAAGKVHKATE